jgi:hypothetical protein
MTNDERDQYIRATHDAVIQLKEWARNHGENDLIHQVPPCEHHKVLVTRLWGVAVLVVTSIIASLWAVIKAGAR